MGLVVLLLFILLLCGVGWGYRAGPDYPYGGYVHVGNGLIGVLLLVLLVLLLTRTVVW
jgi:hypothetical protein